MKKILVFLIAFFGITTAYAADYGVSLSAGTVEAGKDFTVSVSVTGANNLWGFSGSLTYDTSKITLVNQVGENGFNVEVGTNIVLDSNKGVSGTVKVATLTFRPTAAFTAGQSTVITIGASEGTNGDASLTGSSGSVTVSVPVPKSGNNNLSSLSVTGGTMSPAFNKNTTNYTVETEKDIISISATLEDSKAKMDGSGPKTLNYGKNTITITVTAENGSVKKYVLTVNRKDTRNNDSTLKSLTISPATIEFKPNVKEYNITVDSSVDSIVINAIKNNPAASVNVKENTKVDLTLGKINVIKIVVTAENKTTTTYTLNVLRGSLPSSVCTLASLSIEGVDLEFNEDVYEYTVNVPMSFTEAFFHYQTTSDKATAQLSGNTMLQEGANLFVITVTSEGGEVKEYKVTINRLNDGSKTTTTTKVTTTTKEDEIKPNQTPLDFGEISCQINQKRTDLIFGIVLFILGFISGVVATFIFKSGIGWFLNYNESHKLFNFKEKYKLDIPESEEATLENNEFTDDTFLEHKEESVSEEMKKNSDVPLTVDTNEQIVVPEVEAEDGDLVTGKPLNIPEVDSNEEVELPQEKEQ